MKQTIPWSSFTKLPSIAPVQFAPRLFNCDDHEGDIPHGAGMILETTPEAPAANDVFSPHELEARIAKYAKRAAAKRAQNRTAARTLRAGTTNRTGGRSASRTTSAQETPSALAAFPVSARHVM